MREQNETPGYEARHHSKGFLTKAARMASKTRGKKRGKGRTHSGRK